MKHYTNSNWVQFLICEFAYIWLSGLATRTEHIKVRRIRNRKKEIIIGVAMCGSPRKSPGKNIIRFNKLESCGWPLSFVFAATLPVTRCCCNGIHKKICHCLEPHLWAFFCISIWLRAFCTRNKYIINAYASRACTCSMLFLPWIFFYCSHLWPNTMFWLFSGCRIQLRPLWPLGNMRLHNRKAEISCNAKPQNCVVTFSTLPLVTIW